MPSPTSITAHAKIDGTTVPVYSLDATIGGYGSVGSARFSTAISALAAASFGPQNPLKTAVATAQPSAADGSPNLPIELWINGAAGQPMQRLFGGDLDNLNWDFDGDELTIECRDYAGRLKDWKVSLDTTWTNMTPTQVAQRVASKVGLTLVLPSNLPAQTTVQSLMYQAGQSGTPGAVNFLGSSAQPAMWTEPRDVWDLLNFLARMLGWTVYAKPDKTLYFGPVQPTAPRVLTWRATGGANVPVRNLKILHSPRRNGTFKVVVMSYHNPSLQFVTGTAVGFEAGTTFPTGELIKAGVYKNADVLSAAVEEGKPTYFYNIAGLTPPAVEQISLAIGFDIAKRLYVVSGEIDGDPTLLPTMPMTLAEAVNGALQGYTGVSLQVASVSHSFSMSEGYWTRFKAWYAPPAPAAPNLSGAGTLNQVVTP